MEIDLIEYLVGRTPQHFLQNTSEALEAAFFQAFRESTTYEEPERYRILPQARHYRQNAAYRDAGHKSGLKTISKLTSSKGESYPIVISSDIRYGRIGVNFGSRTPRPADHRAEIAAVNGRFEQENYELFRQIPERGTEGLGALIVTVNPHSSEPQDLPAKLIVGIPYTNFKGWHLYEPFETLMAAYSKSQEIEVPDEARPALIKRLRSKEE